MEEELVVSLLNPRVKDIRVVCALGIAHRFDPVAFVSQRGKRGDEVRGAPDHWSVLWAEILSKSAHRAGSGRDVDVGENQNCARTGFQERNSFVRIRGLGATKSACLDGKQPRERQSQ